MTPAGNSDAFEATNHDAIRNPDPMDIDTTPVRIRPGSYAHREKQCPKCGRWVGIGIKGSLYSLVRHMDGERCRRATELEAQQRGGSLEVRVATSTSFVPEPLPAHTTPPIPSYPRIPLPEPTQLSFSYPDIPPVVNSPSFLSLTPLPPLVPPGQTSCLSPTTLDTMGLNTLEVPPAPPLALTAPPQEPGYHLGFPMTTKVPCCGVLVNWESGHPSKTYPFQYHDTDSPTWSTTTPRPPNPNIIRLQSFLCTFSHDSSTEACFECLRIPSSDKFRSVILKASGDPAPTVPWGHLSWEQMYKRLKDKTDECRRYRKRVGPALYDKLGANGSSQESSRKSSRLTRRLDDYERLFALMCVSDYKNMSQVLRVALNNGSSPAAIISKLQLAIDKKYTPHPSTDELTLDLAYLVKAIGGPKLLHALNRALGLPSYRTIGNHRKVPLLTPTTLAPSFEDASTNISTFFNPQERPPSTHAGHSIMIDGVALEERCRWHRPSNSVIGLCREHAGVLDLRVVNPQSVIAIGEAVHAEKPRAHYSSEATVVAIAPFRSSGYAAIPFALSGSCKAETGEGMAKWVMDMVRAWNDHPDGATAHGPVWSIATDGESTMRTCRFALCMSRELLVTNPLRSFLQNLTGLNLFTGAGDMTMTCDPKHIFKRLSASRLTVHTG